MHSDFRNERALICLLVLAGVFLGGVHSCSSTASSIFYGRVQLDAGGGSVALEQSGRSQPERGSAHEVLLSHRLGYKHQQDK